MHFIIFDDEYFQNNDTLRNTKSAVAETTMVDLLQFNAFKTQILEESSQEYHYLYLICLEIVFMCCIKLDKKKYSFFTEEEKSKF